ncbi:MAG: phosphopentomutase [Rhodothermales bacterium]
MASPDPRLFVTLVLDGVGIGEQPDAGRYGDVGSHTLGHVCATAHPKLPHLAALGLGCIAPLDGVPAHPAPGAQYGRLTEVSAGKDSTTGHWELAGIRLDKPFPTFPDGFPDTLIHAFIERTGCPGVLGNRADSGTAIIDALGAEHQETSWPIVYTSADSVFQVAAHVDTIPLETLYRYCQIARDALCVGPYGVGRVIARPFEGQAGNWRRISAARKDYARLPESKPLQAALSEAGVATVSVGKVADLFGHVGFEEGHKTRSNDEGIAETLRQMRRRGVSARPAFIWVNLVDFDQEYGHRNDPHGFARALEAFDRSLPEILAALPPGGRLVITADHGNDPTTPGTDHSREYVPLLYVDGRPGADLGTRATFADHAATVAAYFGVDFPVKATPFGER